MLVFSYKSDYTNTCRGCTMESYGSDLEIHHFVDDKEAIEYCAQKNAQTQIDQIGGEGAWQHYFVYDGFEKSIQKAQCYDPDIDGVWTSQGESECFVKPTAEQQAAITARTLEIYSEFVEGNKILERERKEKEQKEKLAQDIARAKALLAKHSQF